MADEAAHFSFTLKHVQEYEFRVRFDWDPVDDLTLDEGEPLGNHRRPNGARLLAAAAASCLSVSLRFCMRNARCEPVRRRTVVNSQLARSPNGRLRVSGLQVAITVALEGIRPERLSRCTELFEDYCVVTESIRRGIPVSVQVRSDTGDLLYRSAGD